MTLIIGHRGARGEAPENTLGGFRYLKSIGVKAVEFDVRQIATGELVVIHDDNLTRTTGFNVPIEQLQAKHRFAYSHTHRFPDWLYHEPLPLLDEVLNIIADFEHIEIEIKSVQTNEQALQLCGTLMHYLQQFIVNTQINPKVITITSFDIKILNALNQIESPYTKGLLLEKISQINQSVEQALSLHCQRICLHYSLVTEVFIEQIKKHQLSCSIWTVNQADLIQQFCDWNVDGIITDYPKRCITV